MISVSDTDRPEEHAGKCFHCGEPLTPGHVFNARALGADRPMCCAGCVAVAETIVSAGLEAFYRHRSNHPLTPPSSPAVKPLEAYAVYDRGDVQKAFVDTHSDNASEATLLIEGMACPSCAWLIERRLNQLAGIRAAHVNLSQGKVFLRWEKDRVGLSAIFAAIDQLGYRAYPEDRSMVDAQLGHQRRAQLRRIGIAGLFGAQVMMIAVSLYFGEAGGIAVEFEQFFRYLSLVLSAPVLCYSGAPILRGAYRDLRNRYLGMDVPVALGLLVAFGGSTWNTLAGSGPVYFESVCMFVFFLLVSRYFEFMARKRAYDAAAGLRALAPAVATRVDTQEESRRTQEVAVADLAPGDRIFVGPGDKVPADGVVLNGVACVDEALLTGEPMPHVRRLGDSVIAGSVVLDSPLEVRVTALGPDTVLSRIVTLAEKAQAERSPFADLAHRITPWFIAGVLTVAVVTGVYWYVSGASSWLGVLIAVLVAACPCALSLSVPAANAAASEFLLKHGILIRSSASVEALAGIDYLVFDKTGTLTEGRPRVMGVDCLDPDFGVEEVLVIAASLELELDHPIARALRDAAPNAAFEIPDEVTYTPGHGVSGVVGGRRCWLGNRRFVAEFRRVPLPEANGSETLVYLADAERVLGVIRLSDVPRQHAREVVELAHRFDVRTLLLSGDTPAATTACADRLGIKESRGALSADQKLERLEALRTAGNRVAMVGDGLNDMAVLAAADVAIAMGEGSRLAQTRADMILMQGDRVLRRLRLALVSARRALQIMRQNVAWALGYNVLAIPFAAMGWLSPWLAALGMSLSSLLVTGNSLRLLRGDHWQRKH